MRFNDGQTDFRPDRRAFRRRYRRGQDSRGTRLPSARDIALSFEVNPNTAVRAAAVAGGVGDRPVGEGNRLLCFRNRGSSREDDEKIRLPRRRKCRNFSERWPISIFPSGKSNRGGGASRPPPLRKRMESNENKFESADCVRRGDPGRHHTDGHPHRYGDDGMRFPPGHTRGGCRDSAPLA